MTSRFPAPPGRDSVTRAFPPPATPPVEDEQAVHVDKAGEITDLDEKTTLAVDDLFVIEDSAATNTKKKVKFSTVGGWQAWTPSYTNITVGNGTVVARYARVGNAIIAYFEFTLGSTSAVGSSPLITTPVAHNVSTYTAGDNIVGVARFDEDGVAARGGTVRLQTTTQFRPIVWNAASTFIREANVSSTAPFTWGSNDVLQFSATYEAA